MIRGGYRVVSWLNVNNWSPDVPDEMKDHYDDEKYKKARLYQKVNVRNAHYKRFAYNPIKSALGESMFRYIGVLKVSWIELKRTLCNSRY